MEKKEWASIVKKGFFPASLRQPCKESISSQQQQQQQQSPKLRDPTDYRAIATVQLWVVNQRAFGVPWQQQQQQQNLSSEQV